ncbi:hypothetical protein U9M48_039192 [Paspalum notatum var. saurae]|uniref:Uncharacterized protein n=1 Tax=Paspalum notatum var. saurae TaxID=547442 RepID=A0AAQ3XED4_PASNO
MSGFTFPDSRYGLSFSKTEPLEVTTNRNPGGGTAPPTPPAPPRTRTDLPAENPARSRPSLAVWMASGRLAACAKSRPLGLSASSFSSTAVYSASEPDCLGPSSGFSLIMPYTSSPSLRLFTWLPTFTTTPAMSYPGTSVAWNLPARRLASTGLRAAATTLTSTWSSPMAGTATASSSLSTLASP